MLGEKVPPLAKAPVGEAAVVAEGPGAGAADDYLQVLAMHQRRGGDGVDINIKRRILLGDAGPGFLDGGNLAAAEGGGIAILIERRSLPGRYRAFCVSAGAPAKSR